MSVSRAAAGALAVAVALTGCDRSSSPATTITAQRIELHTRVLGDDSMAGRGTGQPGYQRAVDYVVGQFTKLGLRPGGQDGGFLQPVFLRETRLEHAAVTVTRAGRAVPLVHGDDFVSTGNHRDTSVAVSAPVVFVGYGVVAPAFGRDDYAGVDVTGKIVAALQGAPASIPPNPRAHYSGAEKARTAAARGAVGMITLSTPESEAAVPWAFVQRIRQRPAMTWLDGAGTLPADLPILPGALVPVRVAASLLGVTPEGYSEVVAAAQAGRSRPTTLPGSVRIETVSRHRDLSAPNVIAMLPGGDPNLAGEYLVFTAHLDHDGIAAPIAGDSIYNGVFDNASAVAALIEIARAFSVPKPKRSILFIATAAEEKGLLGATYFAAHPTVPIDSIVANLNMDGNHLLFPTRSVVALGSEHSSLGEVAAQAAAGLGIELETSLMPEQAFFIRSDQYPFVKRGVPAMFFLNGTRSTDSTIDGGAVLGRWLQTVYHTPKDDLAQPIDWESGARYARLVLAIGRAVADGPDRPRWRPGDFFGETFGRR